MPEAEVPNCPHCAAPLPPGALVCPTCRRLVYEARLVQLSADAMRLEQIDPLLAAGRWRELLTYLPSGAGEYPQIAARAAALASGQFGPQGVSPGPAQAQLPPPRPESPATVLMKTGGSMALSVVLYWQMSHRWPFAIGFILLIFIHEMGHVIANWHYGIRQSPPIFLPYMGAVIFLRDNPRDAKVESVIGIAGPIAGTLGALICYAIFVHGGNYLYLQLAEYGFFLNLFNMIPCPPLDGGRVAAAITPWLWIPGALAFAGILVGIPLLNGHMPSWITVFMAFWILQSTLPRIRDVIFRGGTRRNYYRIGAPARLGVIAAYVLLTGLLIVMMGAANALLRFDLLN